MPLYKCITFTTLCYGDVHPIGFSRIVTSVEAGFGIIVMYPGYGYMQVLKCLWPK